MSKPLTIALPPDIDVWGSCSISVTAVDPVTGDDVSGVDVSNVTLQVTQTAGAAADLAFGPFMLVPGPGA